MFNSVQFNQTDFNQPLINFEVRIPPPPPRIDIHRPFIALADRPVLPRVSIHVNPARVFSRSKRPLLDVVVYKGRGLTKKNVAGIVQSARQIIHLATDDTMAKVEDQQSKGRGTVKQTDKARGSVRKEIR